MTRSDLIDAARWCGMTVGVFLLASGGFRSSGITQVEFDCEQTAAHLERCCSDFSVTAVQCDYWEGCGVRVEPYFDVPTSACLQAMSCEELQASGTCARVMEVIGRYNDAADAGEPATKEGMCR